MRKKTKKWPCQSIRTKVKLSLTNYRIYLNMVACRCKRKISENKNKNNEYHCYVLPLLVIWELEKRIIQQ